MTPSDKKTVETDVYNLENMNDSLIAIDTTVAQLIECSNCMWEVWVRNQSGLTKTRKLAVTVLSPGTRYLELKVTRSLMKPYKTDAPCHANNTSLHIVLKHTAKIKSWKRPDISEPYIKDLKPH